MAINDEQWEGGLFQAFQSPEGESVLDAIHRLHGVSSNFLLRDVDDGASPVLLRRKADGAAGDDSRYQILGEIARGGIGIVYKGRDKDLNRDVALKVLRPEYAHRDDVVRRFVEEAQVGGQLQHPGIVPIYALGLREDGRPCFAMKLIKGQTLASLLDRNPRSIDLLSVFEQVAQTMAYAHSRGVIHRDLKPANVMVGAFGEVQVVDWGFAKIIGQDELTPRPEQTVITTVRSSGEGSDSVAGSVMGTPAYMPPEQALGRIDELDERADVFALGAILMEILTGEPPYTGVQTEQLISAAQCLLDPALLRLDAAAAAEDLKRLVRDCLSPLPGDRPANAAVIAERLSEHFTGLEEQARQDELDALESEARAVRDRKGRLRSLVLAGIVLVAVLACSGGYLSWQREQTEREERAAGLIAAAVRETRRAEGEARWPDALAAAQKALDIARSEGVDDARPRRLLAELTRKRDEAEEALRLREADQAFLDELEEARALAGDHYDRAVIDARYTAAIRKRWPTGEIDTGRLRSSPDAARFAAALDEWAFTREDDVESGVNWQEVRSWARAIDPDTNHIRDALADVEALEALITSEDAEALPVAMVSMIGDALNMAGLANLADEFLRQGHRRHPDDFWLNLALSQAHRGDEVAVRYCYAALAVRPQSVEARHSLGIALEEQGDLEGALAAWGDVLAEKPEWGHGLVHVAIVLGRLDRHEEAEDVWRKAARLDPVDSSVHKQYGPYLMQRGKYREAVIAFERAVEDLPEVVEDRIWLGAAYRSVGRFADAEQAHREAVRMAPEYPNAHFHLGYTFLAQGRYPDAIAAFQRVVEIDETRADAFINLSYCYSRSGDPERAMAAATKATELDPEHQNAWTMLSSLHELADEPDAAARAFSRAVAINEGLRHQYGLLLLRVGRYADAGKQFRRTLKADPGHEDATYFLGTALLMSGAPAEAVPQLESVIRANPARAEAWCNLGNSLRDLGRFAEARDKLERGHELGSARPQWGFPSAEWLARVKLMTALEPRLGKLIGGEDVEATAGERAVLAEMLTIKGHHAKAVRFFKRAFTEEPTLLQYEKQHTWPALKAAARVAGPERDTAREWLRAVLTQVGEAEPGPAHAMLLHLQRDPVLAPLRDAEDLPEDWVKLWAEVERARKAARDRLAELHAGRSR